MSRIKKLPNAANRKNLPSVSPANSTHILSLDELENAHKSPSKVREVHIAALGGVVYSRPVSADIVEHFIEMTSGEDKVSQKDMIQALSEFASAALCNKDGSDFLPLERAKKLSIETLTEVCAGIATGGTRKGKGSRR